MKEHYKVSVVIPVYNTDQYINRCVTSIINQEYKNIEILLINDGSVDKSAEICDNFASIDERISVIHKKNEGVSVARNTGLKNCTGDYVVFVDSDDYVLPGYISSLIKPVYDNQTELSIIDYFIEDNNERYTWSLNDNITIEMSSKETLDKIYDEKLYLGYLWNKLFSVKIIRDKNIEFKKGIKIWEDLLFCCEYINEINKTSYCHNPLYVYYQRSNSAVHNRSTLWEKSKLLAIEKIYNISREYTGNFYITSSKKYANLLISSYFSDSTELYRYNKDRIKNIVSIVKDTGAKLTKSHYILYCIMKYAPFIAYQIAKKKCK